MANSKMLRKLAIRHPQVRARQGLRRTCRYDDLLGAGPGRVFAHHGIEIARREGVHPSVISRIKTRVERRITAETDGKAASLKARQIGEIRRARREAWRGWEESCKPAAKTTRRSGGKGFGASATGTVEQNEVKGQSGNPAFLDKVYDGIRLEARITGTEAPQKQSLDGEIRLPIRVIDEIYTDPQD